MWVGVFVVVYVWLFLNVLSFFIQLIGIVLCEGVVHNHTHSQSLIQTSDSQSQNTLIKSYL